MPPTPRRPRGQVMVAYDQSRHGNDLWEWYATKSGDAPKRARALRKLGFKATAVHMGPQEMREGGRRDMTLVEIRGHTGTTDLPTEGWRLERLQNVSRRRKYVRKRRVSGIRTVPKTERSMCLECFRYVGKGARPVGRRIPTAKRDLVESHGYCRPCGEAMKAEIHKLLIAKRKWKAAINPDRHVAAAVRKSEEFHGKPPRRVTGVKINWPKSLVHLGPCGQLDYISAKWGGKLTRYFHEFTGRCDVFAAPVTQPDGDGLLILKGDFKLKSEGITG